MGRAIAFVLIALLTVTTARAVEIDRIEQGDSNGSGQPDETRIHARFATDNDLITVIDGSGDMQVSDDWRISTDFRNDIWIFDAGADGRAELIIQFRTDANNRLYADFHIDSNGDSMVNYQRSGSRVEVRENQVGTPQASQLSPPVIIASVQDDWVLPDGSLNYNILFLMDGANLRVRDSSTYTMNFMANWDRFTRWDGQPDQQYEFVDADGDGIPESAVWRLLIDTPSSISAARSWLWSNVGRTRPGAHPNAIFFPYLVTYTRDPARDQTLRYFDLPPSVEMDWGRAQITPVLFRGYPVENGFHVGVNLRYLEPDIVNYANFENQQAYYDMAGDNDNLPELHVRHRYYDAADPDGWFMPTPIDEIRWSWNQSNAEEMVFDHKLSLGGRHTITDEVQIGRYRYNSIPYDQLRDWVLSETWDMATFVAVEDRRYASTEGIYEWNTVEHVPLNTPNSTVSAYLAGNIDIQLQPTYDSIPPGMRGEFVDPYGRQPELYFSPIDRRLHLAGAQLCLWNVDGAREIRCDNLNGDDYLDYWAASSQPRQVSDYTSVAQAYGISIEPYLPPPAQQLIHLDRYLIYADANNVSIRAQAVERALFTVQPPSDTASWQALDALLNEHGWAQDAPVTDLSAFYEQFDGAELRLKNARARAFRSTENGVRFILEALPGLEIDRRLPLDLDALAPGEYTVEIDGDAVRIAPLGLPDIQVALRSPFGDAAPLETVRVAPLNVVIENRGLRDVPLLRFQVFAQPVGGSADERYLFWDGIAPADGGSQSVQPINWTPPDTGEWEVDVIVTALSIPSLEVLLTDITKLENVTSLESIFIEDGAPLTPDNAALIEASATFSVNPPPLSAETVFTLGGEQPLNGALIIALFGFIIVIGAAVFALILRFGD